MEIDMKEQDKKLITNTALISIGSSSFTRKNLRVSNVSTTYNVCVTFSASLFWGIRYLTDFSFDPKVLLFSLGYGVFYTTAMLGLYNALQTGSVSLTAFVKQLSLMDRPASELKDHPLR